VALRIFCDFDGTVALNDVGNELFIRFADGRWVEPVSAWTRGEISSRECLIQECAFARATVEQLERFAEEQELDPTFRQFVNYCRAGGIPVAIVSDGLDFYIERILERHGYDDLPFFANHLEFDNGRLIPTFPYYAFGCGRCGNCKGYHVRSLAMPDEVAVYIGDGLSDRCGAEVADLVFAKDDLLRYCQAQGIVCREFRDFADILRTITNREERR
jgi:2,3-diketo-5-methylthio-1-phosphopentane phosphatase